MADIRTMINCISNDDFNGAREALKVSLAEYMAGKKYLSNAEMYGIAYPNPNKEEQVLSKGLTESDEFDLAAFEKNMDRIKRNGFQPRHFLADVEEDGVDTWDKLIANPEYGKSFVAELDQLDFRGAVAEQEDEE